MQEPTQLETASLLKQLSLNRTAQVELESEKAKHAQTRETLVSEFKLTQASVFDAIGDFGSHPSPNNKRRLLEFRRAEETAKRALLDFDILSGVDDLSVLVENEKVIIEKLKAIKKNGAQDSYQTELADLRKKLAVMYPRYLALSSFLSDNPPGLMNIEALVLRDFNYRIALDKEYQTLLADFETVEGV